MLEHERIRVEPCGCRYVRASGELTAVCTEHQVERAGEIARENARLREVIERQCSELAALRAALGDMGGCALAATHGVACPDVARAREALGLDAGAAEATP